MSEPVASALLNVIFDKLADGALKQYVRSQGLHSDLKNLGKILKRIQALLNDASQKEITDRSVGLWLNHLQHLAYDMDDVLDRVAFEAMDRELNQESSGSITSVLKRLLPSCCSGFSLSRLLSYELDSITTELQQLEKQKSDLLLIVKDQNQKDANRGNETCLPEPNVVGREGEKKALLNKLLWGESCEDKFSIIPIVGMGGVGKTTLARLLYNDPQVQAHFELMPWVCVSDDFDILTISNTILQSVTKKNTKYEDLNQLQVALTEQFKDKRFLLVLDDVWTESYDLWEKLVRPLNLGAPGSKILLTTRKTELLKMLGFDNLDLLESLSSEDALSLFALHALGMDNFDSYPDLREKGETIVKKCGTLPLALKAIGRLLRSTTQQKWDDVLNSKIWDSNYVGDLSADWKVIFPALMLSYHDLSANLKRLFAYCSLFPKDFLFKKEDLVLLWMAEGFLSKSSATKSSECLGLEYFEELLSRSFFQYAPNDESLFVMHDLMNDLATYVSGDLYLRFDNDNLDKGHEALAKYRHMSFIREEYVAYHKFEAFERAKSLRTFLVVSAGVNQSWDRFYLSNKILAGLVISSPLLRVLCLNHFEITEVPEFIGTLKHLRHLNLSQTKIEVLPEAVSNLYNLHTLIVFSCEKLTKLPKSFSELKSLRHLDIRDTPLLAKLPLGIGELKNLHTLTKIIIGEGGGFTINELKGLENLHGKISIEGLHNVQSAMQAREANLPMKRLTKLELKWNDGSQQGTLEKDVLAELKPDSDILKELAIVSYGGTEFPNWVGSCSFHQLVHVSILGCRKCTSLPPLGQLRSLQELFIQGMDEVKVIGLDLFGTIDVAFPSLKILGFEDMSGWEIWTSNHHVSNEVFPRLRELHIKDCPKLIDVSIISLLSLRVLHIDRCGDGVLSSLVHSASSITKLEIISILGLTYEVWSGVIEYLREVEEVIIKGCNEIRYLWESKADACMVFENLKKLYVYNCSNLVSLGEKENDNSGSNLLSSLRMLDVWNCNSMESCWCPNSVESLRIFWCSSLKRVSFPTSGGGQKLMSLNILGCEQLMEMNSRSMPMLEVVYIYGWKNLKSVTHLSNFIHLTRLSLCDCPSIELFPDLQLSNLMLLTDLEIINCPSIDASFHRGLWPPKLCFLEIGGLKKPISVCGPLDFPTSLVDLTLCGEDVSNFIELSNLLPLSLTKLHIKEFYKLESLSEGLQHLTSLQHLIIEKCPMITHLPETVLSSLLSLTIFESPNLKERCDGQGSHYWCLISHIPCISI